MKSKRLLGGMNYLLTAPVDTWVANEVGAFSSFPLTAPSATTSLLYGLAENFLQSSILLTDPLVDHLTLKVATYSSAYDFLSCAFSSTAAAVGDSAVVNSSSATELGSHNFLRNTRELELISRCHLRFVMVARNEEIEYGFVSASERLMKEMFQEFPDSIGAIAQGIFLLEIDKPAVLISLIKAISAIPYAAMWPYSQMIAISALANANEEVREAGIRAFEQWEHPDGIKLLKSTTTALSWLEEYKLATITYLESLQ